jgi:hypothetical protein
MNMGPNDFNPAKGTFGVPDCFEQNAFMEETQWRIIPSSMVPSRFRLILTGDAVFSGLPKRQR